MNPASATQPLASVAVAVYSPVPSPMMDRPIVGATSPVHTTLTSGVPPSTTAMAVPSSSPKQEGMVARTDTARLSGPSNATSVSRVHPS